MKNMRVRSLMYEPTYTLEFVIVVDLMSNDRVMVDFRPLYQCLHIHDVLGIRTFFRNHYEENRRVRLSHHMLYF